MTSSETNETGRRGHEPQRELPQRENERALLALLLAELHPWTIGELVRELGGREVETRDALDGLIRAGLVNRDGESVLASRAARAFEELEA